MVEVLVERLVVRGGDQLVERELLEVEVLRAGAEKSRSARLPAFLLVGILAIEELDFQLRRRLVTEDENVLRQDFVERVADLLDRRARDDALVLDHIALRVLVLRPVDGDSHTLFLAQLILGGELRRGKERRRKEGQGKSQRSRSSA
jgi:hypothetical protein